MARIPSDQLQMRCCRGICTLAWYRQFPAAGKQRRKPSLSHRPSFHLRTLSSIASQSTHRVTLCKSECCPTRKHALRPLRAAIHPRKRKRNSRKVAVVEILTESNDSEGLYTTMKDSHESVENRVGTENGRVGPSRPNCDEGGDSVGVTIECS